MMPLDWMKNLGPEINEERERAEYERDLKRYYRESAASAREFERQRQGKPTGWPGPYWCPTCGLGFQFAEKLPSDQHRCTVPVPPEAESADFSLATNLDSVWLHGHAGTPGTAIVAGSLNIYGHLRVWHGSYSPWCAECAPHRAPTIGR